MFHFWDEGPADPKALMFQLTLENRGICEPS